MVRLSALSLGFKLGHAQRCTWVRQATHFIAVQDVDEGFALNSLSREGNSPGRAAEGHREGSARRTTRSAYRSWLVRGLGRTSCTHICHLVENALAVTRKIFMYMPYPSRCAELLRRSVHLRRRVRI